MNHGIFKRTLEIIRGGADRLRATQRSMPPFIILLSSLYVCLSGWFVDYVIGPVLLTLIVCWIGLFLCWIAAMCFSDE